MLRTRRQSASGSEEDRAFLQRRVALFGAIAGGAFLFFLVYRTALSVIGRVPDDYGHPSYQFHVVSALCFLSPWLILRWGRWSPLVIQLTETAALLSGVIAAGLMAAHIPLAARPDFILLLSLTFVVMARAIFVPSSATRSLLLALLVGAELVWSVHHSFQSIDMDLWRLVAPDLETVRAEDFADQLALNTAAWWTMTVFITSYTSWVFYGLRREMRDIKQLGQYRLERKLGEGGMGVVFRAKHALLRRPTAVKLLPPEKAGHEKVRRFEQEVQMTARLRHPNTIRIFDYGHTPEGIFYYAMEYVEGLTLEEVVERTGPLPSGRVVHILQQVTRALVEAHGIGLIHRDIKPANIMIFLMHRFGGTSDFVKVLDFGLVKELKQDGGIDVTNQATISGTPQYMAPEAILNPEQADARTDLYALGAVAYYLLTGSHVFAGDTVVEVCSHHLHTPPEPLSTHCPGIPAQLESLVLACLAKKPEQRPQTALALSSEIAELPETTRWTAADAAAWWRDCAPAASAQSSELSEAKGNKADPRVLTIHLERS